jgi:hypothetical protein
MDIMNGRMLDKAVDAAPGFIVGLVIGTVWSYALGFVSFAFGIGGLSGQTPGYAFLFHPTISILPVAILFSILRKRNVVSGILVIAIAVALFLGHEAQNQAGDAVRESGRTFLSAMIQHFRYKLSGPHSSSMNQP